MAAVKRSFPVLMVSDLGFGLLADVIGCGAEQQFKLSVLESPGIGIDIPVTQVADGDLKGDAAGRAGVEGHPLEKGRDFGPRSESNDRKHRLR